MLEEKSVKAFLDELASAAPTPGGGSAAALLGAVGAALLGMVCRLTVGRRAYAAVEAEMSAALVRSESLRARLEEMVETDIEVFTALMAAYRLPRGSDHERARRHAAVQSALEAATASPLACAQACAEVVELAREVAAKGNPSVLTDVGAGVVAAHAGLRSAALNVYVNTASIEDADFARDHLEALEAVLERAAEPTEAIYAEVVRAAK